MGNCSSKKSKGQGINVASHRSPNRSRRTIDDVLNDSIHSQNRTQRQSMAWVRGMDMNEVYDVLEIIGQGSMGEVTIVQRKECPIDVVQRRQEELSSATSSPSSPTSSPPRIIKQTHFDDHDKHEEEETLEEPESESESEPELESRKERRQYACKTVNTLRMRNDELMEFINEVMILRDLDHPNIVQLFEVFQVKRKLWIITELCSGGDLSSRAHSMTEAGAVIALEQILRALAYMHKRNVCHRDIKLENIMYTSRHDHSEVKLIDFGLSNKFTKGHKMLRACGTIYTAAPEIILSTNGGAEYTQQTDIWSIGVCAFVLLSKEYPFLRDRNDINNPAKKQALAQAEFSFGPTWDKRNISQEARFFVQQCLQKEPFHRWTARDALEYIQHRWIPYLEQTLDSSDYDNTQIDSTDAANLTTSLRVDNDENDTIINHHNKNTNNHEPTCPESCYSTASSSSNSSSSSSSNPSSSNNNTSSSQPLKHSVASIRKRAKINSSIIKGMTTFALYGELKKTILMTMAYTMDKASMVELRDIFTSLDTNRSGTITLIELKQALQSMHSSENKVLDNQTIEKLFKGVDVDKSGEIHYNEFLAAVVESQGLITQEHLAETFDRLDSTGKGYITKDDLKNVLGTNYNESAVTAMMEEASSSTTADLPHHQQQQQQQGNTNNNDGGEGQVFVDYNAFLQLMFCDPTKGMSTIGNENMAHNTSMVGKLGNIY